MDLDKIFNAVYFDFIDELDVSRAGLEHAIFKYMLEYTKDWGNYSSILFFNELYSSIGYRSSFEDKGHYIIDDYEFQRYKNILIPTNENPSEIKNKVSDFVSEMRKGIYKPMNKHEEQFIHTHKDVKDAMKIANKYNQGNKMKNVFDKMLETNKNTAMYTAKVQLGKTVNKVVLDKIKPQLPMFVKGYAESPLAELVVGNIVAGLLMQFAPNNEKATILANAMIAAGTQVAVESMNIPELIAELLDSVDISGVTEEE